MDDDSKEMVAILTDVIYVPGLSRHLFSITRFADHGHYAVIRKHGVSLHFGEADTKITLPLENGIKCPYDDSTNSRCTDNDSSNRKIRDAKSNDHSRNWSTGCNKQKEISTAGTPV